MAIPESQLEVWSHIGSITQSSTTYNAIKETLELTGSPYASQDYKVFLQGSYGNDTNIYAESDVDIIIQLNSCFYYDLESISDQNQKTAFEQAFTGSVIYDYPAFKRDVLAFLKEKYGDSVKPGDKAIKIEANSSRRNADVLIAVQYRRYYKFLSIYDQGYYPGICFYNASQSKIINYPTLHSENCTAKHQATNQRFKPMVRVLKNLRSKLVEQGIIEDGVAPSYYIEGLLYNVPNEKYVSSIEDSFINCINWILQADRSAFVCANERYYLLREGSPVTWRESKCNQFLDAVCELWKRWK